MSLAESSRCSYRKMEASESPMTDPGIRDIKGTASPSPSPPSASSDLSSAPDSIILSPMSIQSQTSRLLKTPSEVSPSLTTLTPDHPPCAVHLWRRRSRCRCPSSADLLSAQVIHLRSELKLKLG